MLPQKLLEIIKKNRLRKLKLQAIWEEERAKMIQAYRNIKKKTRKSRETIKKLRNLRPNLRNI